MVVFISFNVQGVVFALQNSLKYEYKYKASIITGIQQLSSQISGTSLEADVAITMISSSQGIIKVCLWCDIILQFK